MAKSSPQFSTSKRLYKFERSKLFNLGSAKFIWRVVMIVEIFIAGMINYWICRDPPELREYEEAFLKKYVYPLEDLRQPIPSVFHNQTELTSMLCEQFVLRTKPPRIEVRLLGFKKAIHKPVPIEVVKCGRGVALVQAPGYNSFYVLQKGKQSKKFDTKVFTIFRKAWYVPHYSDEDEEYEAKALTRPLLSTSHSLPTELPRSYSAPKRYRVGSDAQGKAVEQVSRTVITSDLPRNSSLRDRRRRVEEDYQSPRLAVRSPHQYHTLSDVQRYGLHFSSPSKLDQAVKFLKRLFTKSRKRRHRSERMRSYSSTVPSNAATSASRLYRSKSEPRNNQYATQNRTNDQHADKNTRRDSVASEVRQPHLQDAYHPSTKRTEQHEPRRSLTVPKEPYHATTNPIRPPHSPPSREPGKQYDLRVRLSQSDEELRRRNTSYNGQYATRNPQNHPSALDQDDVRRVTLPPIKTPHQEYETRSHKNPPTKPVPPHHHQNAARAVPYYPSAQENGYVRHVPTAYPQYAPKSNEKYYPERMNNDYLVGGLPSDSPPYAYPYYHNSRSQADLLSAAEAERARQLRISSAVLGKGEARAYGSAYPQYSGVQPEVKTNKLVAFTHDSAPHPDPHYRVDGPRPTPHERSFVQDSRHSSSVPVAERTGQSTRVLSTCRKCHSVLNRNRPPVEASLDRGAKTQISSDERRDPVTAENRHPKAGSSSSVPVSGGREESHARSVCLKCSAALGQNRHQEASSMMAETGSLYGRDRSMAKNSRADRTARVSSTLLDDEDQPDWSARASKGRRSVKRKGQRAKSTPVDRSSTTSEEEYPASERRSRSTARHRSGQRKAAEEKLTQNASRRRIAFQVSIDGERESS